MNDFMSFWCGGWVNELRMPLLCEETQIMWDVVEETHICELFMINETTISSM